MLYWNEFSRKTILQAPFFFGCCSFLPSHLIHIYFSFYISICPLLFLSLSISLSLSRYAAAVPAHVVVCRIWSPLAEMSQPVLRHNASTTCCAAIRHTQTHTSSVNVSVRSNKVIPIGLTYLLAWYNVETQRRLETAIKKNQQRHCHTSDRKFAKSVIDFFFCVCILCCLLPHRHHHRVCCVCVFGDILYGCVVAMFLLLQWQQQQQYRIILSRIPDRHIRRGWGQHSLDNFVSRDKIIIFHSLSVCSNGLLYLACLWVGCALRECGGWVKNGCMLMQQFVVRQASK